MLITLGRTVLLYILVVVTMRLMGKRQIAQLEPFELVIAIMIAELGVIPMQDRNIPLINGIIAITTLLFIQVTFSVASLRFFGFRSFLDGRYSIIIANGVIQEREMRKARYNLDELFEQLRLKSIFNLGDVEFAILETSGELSVLLKSQKRTVTPKDLRIETNYEGLPLVLIVDGQVMTSELNKSQLSEAWLRTELEKHGIKSPKEILVASLDTSGELFFQPKES
ncbi:MAG TPA: hypothetical protein DDZ66_01195 [Firmicutes bacterium]|jgi:uncharacterized membrane protein YcaP (DUF421 family)|nr:hypothetical protein [Bacillota bacterium]